MEELEGGGVNGVAAEVAEEVYVFFEDGDFDAGTGEEEAEHDSGGAAADDAAGGVDRLRCGDGHFTSAETAMEYRCFMLEEDAWRSGLD